MRLPTLLMVCLLAAGASTEAQVPPPGLAAKVDPNYYGNLEPIPVAAVVAEFNERHRTSMRSLRQKELTEEELKGALVLALDNTQKLNQITTLKQVLKTGILPRGTRLLFEDHAEAVITGPEMEAQVHLIKIEMEFGITVPDDPNRQLIPSAEEWARRWTLPVRLQILSYKVDNGNR